MKFFKSAIYFLAAWLFIAPIAQAANTNDGSSDVIIKTKILTTYTLNTQLNPFDFDVAVNNGIVTLNGSVANPAEQELAVDIARGVDGVNKVINNIKIDANVKQHLHKTGFAQTVDDASTTAMVKSKLLLNRRTSGLSIHVKTENSMVTLDGDVATLSEKQLAGKIAARVNGVNQVINNLQVKS